MSEPIDYVKIIGALNKPLIKLVDVTAKGAGNVFSLCFAKKIVDNKKYEIEQVGNAIENNGTLLGEVHYDNGKISLDSLGSNSDSLEERAKLRKEFQLKKEQNNIENIISYSAINLDGEEKVSEESVDDDWIARFFKYAENVTTEDMQKIWGRVLAGEIKQPNSYSLRTLETLKNLTKKDAETLNEISKLTTIYNQVALIINKKEILKKFNFQFATQLHLTELGILQTNSTLSITLEKQPQDNFIHFTTNKYLIRVKKLKDSPKCSFPVILFTSIGSEIIKLINPSINEEYFKEFCSELEKMNLEVEYTFILEKRADGLIRHGSWFPFKS